MTAATAQLVEQLTTEAQVVETENGGFVVVLVVPGEHRTREEADLAADLIADALTEALGADLGPLRVQAQRVPPAPPKTAQPDPATTERNPR